MSISQRCDSILWLIDVALSFFIIFPLCVFHWRGTWELGNRLIPPKNELLLWSSFVVLGIMNIFVCLVPAFLASRYPSSQAEILAPRSQFARKVYSRCYLYVYNWIYATNWRTVWYLLELYIGVTWYIYLPAYAIAQTVRYTTKTTRWGVNCPLSVQRDSSNVVIMTVFQSEVFYVLINILIKNFTYLFCL